MKDYDFKYHRLYNGIFAIVSFIIGILMASFLGSLGLFPLISWQSAAIIVILGLVTSGFVIYFLEGRWFPTPLD